jgi:SAM-dependent methyltransferase
MRTEWTNAQEREVEVWKKWGDEPIEHLKRRARMLSAYCDLGVDASDTYGTLLEIGAAGAPLITFLSARRRIFVDPIFEKIKHLFESQFTAPDGQSEFYSRPAEDLGFIFDDTVDLAFCLNVLDHTKEPRAILEQIRRKLTPEGRVLLSVDCYGAAWLALRAARVLLRGRTENDLLHPHHFTTGSLMRLVEAAGLRATRCFLAPGDGLTKASNYLGTSEYPLRRGVLSQLKRAERLYVVAERR